MCCELAYALPLPTQQSESHTHTAGCLTLRRIAGSRKLESTASAACSKGRLHALKCVLATMCTATGHLHWLVISQTCQVPAGAQEMALSCTLCAALHALV